MGGGRGPRNLAAAGRAIHSEKDTPVCFAGHQIFNPLFTSLCLITQDFSISLCAGLFLNAAVDEYMLISNQPQPLYGYK